MKTPVIMLTGKDLKPNAFGLCYLAWFYSLKGPTFAVYRRGGE